MSITLDLYPGFESTTCFKGLMSETTKLLFMGIKADVYHGMLPDPVEDNILCNLVEGKFLFDLINVSESDEKIITNFTNTTSSVTPYGFFCLQKDVPEHSLSLIWHSCCLSVIYKHDGTLYLLRTSEEQPDMMWCSLLNHEGDGDPFSSTFSPVCSQEKPVINPEDVVKDLVKEEEEEEEKAKGQKLTKGDKAKGKQKHRERPEKDLGRVSDKVTEKEETKEHQIDPPKVDKAAKPTLRDRFTDFLHGFRKDGYGKSYFMGQIEALKYYGNLDMEFSYSLIKEYNENLALSVAASYHSAFEELELGLKNYLSAAMIKGSMTQQEIEFLKDKIIKSAKLKISDIPAPNSVLSFNQFIRKYDLYLVFKTDNLSFDSTTYVGRQMGKGYLKFILRKHKSGWSWNGNFCENDIFVVIVGSSMEFIITLPAHEQFNKDYGVADCNKYIDILIPLYKSHKDAPIPWYLDKLKADFMKMPDLDPMNPDAFDNFQLFIAEHFGWKAPLVRSAFLCNLFRVCRSLVFNEKQEPVKKNIYLPLDTTDGLIQWDGYVQHFCAHLLRVYLYEAVAPCDSRYSRHTFWCALWLGRNTTEHLFDHTKVNGIQLITDVIISDLILEHDLRGILSDVVYEVMQLTKFSREFASIWGHFIASETFDDLKKLLCGKGRTGTESADIAACEDTAPSKVADAAAAIIIALSKALQSLGHSSEAIVAALRALGYSVEDAAASASKSDTGASSSDPTESVTSAGKPNAALKSLAYSVEDAAASASKSNTAEGTESVASAGKPSAACLSHGNATMNRSELMTLQGDGWLEDAVINYMFTLLSSAYKDLYFVTPAISLVLTNLWNADVKTVNAAVGGLQLGSRNLVLFPVNDNQEFDKDNQGKHWSLLILQFSNDHSKCRFIYHDSLHNHNLTHARRLAQVISCDLPKVTEFVEAETLQQKNGFDCGVFVLAMAKAIGDWWKKHGRRMDTGSFQNDWILSLNGDVTQETVKQTRFNLFKNLDTEMQKIEQGSK